MNRLDQIKAAIIKHDEDVRAGKKKPKPKPPRRPRPKPGKRY